MAGAVLRIAFSDLTVVNAVGWVRRWYSWLLWLRSSLCSFPPSSSPATPLEITSCRCSRILPDGVRLEAALADPDSGTELRVIFLNEIGLFYSVAVRPGIAVIGPHLIFGMDKREPFQYSLYQN